MILREWEAIPDPLQRWMEAYGGRPPGSTSAEVLLSAGLQALQSALENPGRTRESAFALLAADALLTEAVGHAAEALDPEAEFRTILEGILSLALEAER